MRALGLLIVAAIAVAPAAALAEKVKTNQEAKLYNHPGEQGAVLLHLKEGQTVTLLNQDGRWLKVRVLGRTGWIPRSKVDLPDDSTVSRNTRRRPFVDGRSTQRGWTGGEAPDDRIGADAVGDQGTADKSGDDDDDDAKKPAKKPAAKKPAAKGDDDDDDDDAKKPAAKKPAATKKPAPKGDDDDDDDDAKKPAAKKPAAKTVAAKKPAAKGDDDDDDDDAKKPAAKKPAAKTVAAKTKPSGDDDDDDDDAKSAKADDVAAPKRARAHVSSKVEVYDRRSKASEVAFVAKPGQTLYVDETHDDWTEIENDDGDEGWVATSALLVDGESGGGSHHLSANLTARTGVAIIQQKMHSINSTLTGVDQVPDAYTIDASAVSLALSGDALYGLSKKLALGVELAWDGSKTIGGGIVYMGTHTAFSINNLNVRAVLDYDLQRPSGLSLWFHLGVRYRAYLVSNYGNPEQNTALVPQETLTAPTLGVAVAVPMVSKKIGLSVGLDAILFGSSIKQTAGLEDGASPSMIGVETNARFIYHLPAAFDFLAAYDLDYGSYDFGGPNMESTRGHTGTDVKRTDVINMLTVGVARAF